MRIVVMGAGGTGGYFGAKLARAGEEVTFVARGAHLAAIREHGLRVRSAVEGEWVVRSAAVERVDGLPAAELVLFCVKSFDTESAAEAIRSVVGPHTGVLSIQNGVDNEDKLARILGPGHVMGGVAQVFATIEAPGVIRHALLGRVIFGEMDGEETGRARAFLAACGRAAIPAEISPRMLRALWEKYVFLVAHAGMTALTRSPAGVIRRFPDAADVPSPARGDGRARPRRGGGTGRGHRGRLHADPRRAGVQRVHVPVSRPRAGQATRAGSDPRPRGEAWRALRHPDSHAVRGLRGPAAAPRRGAVPRP